MTGKREVYLNEASAEELREAREDPDAVIVVKSQKRDAVVDEGYDPARDDMFGR